MESALAMNYYLNIHTILFPCSWVYEVADHDSLCMTKHFYDGIYEVADHDSLCMTKHFYDGIYEVADHDSLCMLEIFVS